MYVRTNVHVHTEKCKFKVPKKEKLKLEMLVQQNSPTKLYTQCTHMYTHVQLLHCIATHSTVGTLRYVQTTHTKNVQSIVLYM